MREQANKPDVAPLVNQLIDKSKAGKLKWQPTANRTAFVVSVGKDISFRIWENDVTEENQWGQPYTASFVRLALLDEKGNQLWDVGERDVPSGLLQGLYDLARRIGNNVDERVAVALTALEKL
jgi:hypothetical protein